MGSLKFGCHQQKWSSPTTKNAGKAGSVTSAHECINCGERIARVVYVHDQFLFTRQDA